MTIIDPALLDSLEKDYFDDPRVLVLVTLFRCAQSKSPVVAQVSSALTSAIEEWKQLGGGGEIIRNEPPPIIKPEIKEDKEIRTQRHVSYVCPQCHWTLDKKTCA